jgi:hypothetical protein
VTVLASGLDHDVVLQQGAAIESHVLFSDSLCESPVLTPRSARAPPADLI